MNLKFESSQRHFVGASLTTFWGNDTLHFILDTKPTMTLTDEQYKNIYNFSTHKSVRERIEKIRTNIDTNAHTDTHKHRHINIILFTFSANDFSSYLYTVILIKIFSIATYVSG